MLNGSTWRKNDLIPGRRQTDLWDLGDGIQALVTFLPRPLGIELRLELAMLLYQWMERVVVRRPHRDTWRADQVEQRYEWMHAEPAPSRKGVKLRIDGPAQSSRLTYSQMMILMNQIMLNVVKQENRDLMSATIAIHNRDSRTIGCAFFGDSEWHVGNTYHYNNQIGQCS